MSEPNQTLADLITESGYSWAGLARRVNTLGAAYGVVLHYDYTAVHRWVRKGERPRSPAPSILAEVLTERLARRITAFDIGMPEDGESLARRGLRYSTDPVITVDTIAELGRADMKRRNVIKAPFVLSALAVPSRDWLLATLEETATDQGPRRVGMRQVEGIREMFRLFQEMDVMHGGGHARLALVQYMDSYVMPLVRRQHAEPVQRALYEAAAEQAYLVGWMTYDDGQHGLAERYLIQALALAQASGNAILGAHVLAGMSDQANLLHHSTEALMLARAGQRGITMADSPACLADLAVLEARAHAALGDARSASIAVARSERYFDQVSPQNEPEWARFIDPAYVFGEAAHCFRDLRLPDQVARFANDSAAEADRQGRARRGALSQAALVVGDLERGEVEAAADRAARVIELAGSVNSSRCIEAVRDLRARFQPHRTVPQVQEFNARAAVLLGTAA